MESIESYFDFTNKVVLVTGSSQGIGAVIALAFAKSKAVTVLNFHTEKEATAAQEVLEQVKIYSSSSIAIQADVRSASSVETMVQTIIKQFGKIDILINNAGITRDQLLIRMSDNDWQSVIDINLTGTFLCTRSVIKEMMKKRYGRIISISSIIGLSGNAGQANYAASKAGIIGFTKSIAKEYGSRNITANCIAPGYIQTNMTEQLSQEVKDAFLNKVMIKRFGLPSDIAHSALFLASDLAGYITGQVMVVDGGLSLEEEIHGQQRNFRESQTDYCGQIGYR